MSKQDWARVRDAGRLIAAAAIAHGVSTKQWSQLHNLGVLLWAAGEAGAQLS
jgi:hypothetical protein